MIPVRARALAAAFAIAALALRVIVPTGLMPASTSEGWFLKLCPDGMPAAVMAALLDDPHHHHHHHHGEEPAFADCEVGAGLSADATASIEQAASSWPSIAPTTANLWIAGSPTQPLRRYNPRAPPTLV